MLDTSGVRRCAGMRRTIAVTAFCALAGCGSETFDVPGRSAPHPIPIDEGRLEWIGTMPSDGWSEGLDWHDGVLWQAFPHSLREKDPATGEILATHTPPSDYSESLAWHGGEVFNVSYATNKIHRGRKGTTGFSWQVIGEVPEIHAWGIEHDGANLIVTGNGTPNLYWLDPKDGKLERTLETPVDDLEDIAWYAGHVWASSYSEYSGHFFRLDPESGWIEDLYALPDPAACEIVDGITFDADGRIYVTGKDCPAIWIGEFVYE